MLNGSRLDTAFQALADPARRAMLARLSLGPASVSELARPLPMSLPAVMKTAGKRFTNYDTDQDARLSRKELLAR